MRIDWFHRTENKRFDKKKPCVPFSLMVPTGADLRTILQTGYAAGFPKGSARGGCVEIQTDAGIYSSPTNSRLNPNTAIFKTWEQLEQEEKVL